MDTGISAVVLAGGQSRRLGMDKTALRIGGKTLLERTVELMAGLCADVVVVTNTPEAHAHPLARTVHDIFPGKGVLGGIYTGLAVAASPAALVVAADMPFLNIALLRYLASLAGEWDVALPVIAGQAEPLHAVYRDTCLTPMRRQLRGAAAPRIISFFPDVRVREVSGEEMRAADPDLLSLFNINTAADMARARDILHQRGLEMLTTGNTP